MSTSVLANLLARVSADTSGFQEEMAGVSKTLAASASKAQQALAGFNTFGQQLTAAGTRLSLALTAPLVGFAAAAVKGSASMDTLRRGLTATMKSAEAAETELKKLQETAKLPAIDLEGAVRGSIRMQTLGTSADESRRIMTELANAIATVGGSKADFGEVIRQLTQMAAAGRVTKENLDPIVERIPQIAAIIKEKFGAAALGDPAKTFEKMGISAKDAITTIIDELAKTERATGGTRNAFENLQAAATQFAVSVGDSIVKATGLDKRLVELATVVENLAARFEALPEAVKGAVLALGAFTAGAPLFLLAAGQIAQSITAIVLVMKTLQGLNIAAAFTTAAFALSNGLVPALTLAEKAAAALLITLRALPWVGLAAGIAYLGSKLIEYGEKGDTVKPKMDAINKKWDEQHGIIRSLNPAYDSLLQHVRAVAPVQDKTAVSANRLAGETSKAAAAIESISRPARQSLTDLLKLDGAFARLWRSLSEAELARARIDMDAPLPDLSAVADIAEIADRAAQSIGNVSEELERQRRIDDVTNATIKDMEGAWEKTGKSAEKANQRTVTTLEKVQREVDRAFNGMARGMADSIVKWRGFGETLKNIAQEFASGILEVFIKRLLKPLQDKFEAIIGTVFGDSAGRVGIINNAVPGGVKPGSPGTPAGGGVAGSAGSLISTIGAIGSAVSAVSGVIGNFQNARQETTLNAIEKSTRYSESHLLNLIGQAQQWWPELGIIRSYLFDSFNPAFASLMSTVEGMAGKRGSNQTIQLVVDGKVLAEALARTLPHHSNAFA